MEPATRQVELESLLKGASVPKWWGMCGVFPGALGVYEGDTWRNKLEFVADRGFHGSGFLSSCLQDAGQLAFLQELAERRGQAFFVHYGMDLESWACGETGDLDGLVKKHIAQSQEMPLPVAQFIVSNGLHRFSMKMPLEQQCAAIAEVLTPVVAQFADAGIEVAIENHGDFYLYDLVSLCGQVPGLSILLDTGNCSLVGERLDAIPDAVFPLICATHFKDHSLAPELKPLHFRLTGATLGEGDVGLTAFYQKLLRLHPKPEEVRMMVEWVPDPDKVVADCLNASLKYLAMLSKGSFNPVPFEAK